MLCIGSCSDARSFYFTTNWAVLTNSVVYDTSFTEDFGSLSYRWIGDIDMTIDRHIVLDGWVDDDGVGTDGDVLSDRWIFDDGGGMNFVHNSKLKNQYLGTFWWQKVPKNHWGSQNSQYSPASVYCYSSARVLDFFQLYSCSPQTPCLFFKRWINEHIKRMKHIKHMKLTRRFSKLSTTSPDHASCHNSCLFLLLTSHWFHQWRGLRYSDHQRLHFIETGLG